MIEASNGERLVPSLMILVNVWAALRSSNRLVDSSPPIVIRFDQGLLLVFLVWQESLYQIPKVGTFLFSFSGNTPGSEVTRIEQHLAYRSNCRRLLMRPRIILCKACPLSVYCEYEQYKENAPLCLCGGRVRSACPRQHAAAVGDRSY